MTKIFYKQFYTAWLPKTIGNKIVFKDFFVIIFSRNSFKKHF